MPLSEKWLNMAIAELLSAFVHGLDQITKLRIDRFSLNLHGRRYFTIFGVELLIDNLEFSIFNTGTCLFTLSIFLIRLMTSGARVIVAKVVN